MKSYIKIIVGVLWVVHYACSESSNQQAYLPPTSLPVEFETRSFEVSADVPTGIGSFQYRTGIFYFKGQALDDLSVYALDLLSGKTHPVFLLTDHNRPFEIGPDADFYVPVEEEGQPSVIDVIVKGRNFHRFNQGTYISSTKIPDNTNGCYLNTIPKEMSIIESDIHRFIPTTCFLSQTDKEMYRRTHNVVRLSNRLSTSEGDPLYGVPFPEDHMDKIMPVNALVETTLKAFDEHILVNFTASPYVQLYDSTLSRITSYEVRSGAFEDFGGTNARTIEDPYDELVHYTMEGHYPAIVVWPDGDLLIRFARWLDPSFGHASFATTWERIQNMGAYTRQSMILFDLRSRKKISEYIIDDPALLLDACFVFDGFIYLLDSSSGQDKDNSLVFQVLDLGKLGIPVR